MGFYMRVEGRLKRFPITWAQHTHQCMRGAQRLTVCFTTIYLLERVESMYSWGGRLAKGTHIRGGL